MKTYKNSKYVRPVAIFLATLLVSFLISRAVVIALVIATVVSSISYISNIRATNRMSWKLFEVLPEIIDHMISGIQSGLSLNETILNLVSRGPSITREYFQEFGENLRAGMNFEKSLSTLQNRFSIPAADQLFEALIFAKSLGGSELLSLLRQIGNFTRQDLALRREISAKQGWIKNSAHLSASAPWILLLLLSAQPSTSAAYSTPSGVVVLLLGLFLTIAAYLWMGRLSKLPAQKRVFGIRNEL